jgi:hypothetical protein
VLNSAETLLSLLSCNSLCIMFSYCLMLEFACLAMCVYKPWDASAGCCVFCLNPRFGFNLFCTVDWCPCLCIAVEIV